MKAALGIETFGKWSFDRVLVPLLLASLLAGCIRRDSADKSAAPEWQTTVVGDRFSFQMPGKPTRSTETPDSPIGKLKMELYILTNDKGTGAYLFNATDLPAVLPEPEGEEIEQRLEAAQQGGATNTKGKILKSEKIKFAGYSGRECLIQLPDTAISRMRIFMVHRTMIIMNAIGGIVSEDANRFFESLKLLKDAPLPEASESAAKPQAKP